MPQNADALVYDVMAAFTRLARLLWGSRTARQSRPGQKSYFISMGYAFVVAAIMGGFLVFFGETFLALFTSKPIVVERGMDRLRVMGLSYAISAFMDCTIAASRGLEQSLVPSIIVIMGSCVFRIAWIFTIFAHFHTIISLYLLYPCSWTITAIAEIIYFAIVYRKTFPLRSKKRVEAN
ncbi:MAG: MATE family efflux transporter [Christensenellales bacterium]